MLDPRWLHAAGFLVAGVLTLLPTAGGDITSYLAYGQEAVSGINPYTAGPQSPGVPPNPITDAVDSPWQTTPSIYGPGFTWIDRHRPRCRRRRPHRGDADPPPDDRRLHPHGPDPLGGVPTEAARRRAAVMWSANPLMISAMVAGAHVDALAALGIVCSFALVRRFPPGSRPLLGLSASRSRPG